MFAIPTLLKYDFTYINIITIESLNIYLDLFND